jgi:hypothetical protein
MATNNVVRAVLAVSLLVVAPIGTGPVMGAAGGPRLLSAAEWHELVANVAPYIPHR